MSNSARPMRLGLLFHTILLTGITANVDANTPPVMLTSPKNFIYPDVDNTLSESLIRMRPPRLKKSRTSLK